MLQMLQMLHVALMKVSLSGVPEPDLSGLGWILGDLEGLTFATLASFATLQFSNLLP